jgi:hypothetical protein
MSPILHILSVLVLSAFCASGMERLDALSQIESRDNDHAVGSHHEVSRYQILPAFWTRAWAGNQQADGPRSPTDPVTARRVANCIMQARCRAFEARYHHAPDDFEFYILWHRPACYTGLPFLRRITAVEADRGYRFATLCQSRVELASTH